MDTTASDQREPRESVFLTAAVARPGGAGAASYRIMNLSEHGARLAKAGDLEAGAPIALTIGSLSDVPAEVMWVHGNLAGIRFDHAIDVHAARNRKNSGQASSPTAGWAAEIKNPYGR